MRARVAGAAHESAHAESATAGTRVGVRAVGRVHPFVHLSDGHELIADYLGAAAARQALAQGDARPTALAAADFDEDGVPDLVSGYATDSYSGVLTLHRGNLDAIYPNSLEAQARKAAGTYTPAPFLSPAHASTLGVAPDFLGAGDFDADGHFDVVAASYGGDQLYLLKGDGQGGLQPARQFGLAGALTAFTTGEINRRDGLTDLVVGVEGKAGAQVLVFEGPDGALGSEPEVFDMAAPVRALALGFLDEHYAADLAVASGRELVIVQGRDRQLSLARTLPLRVKPAKLEHHPFDAAIRALAVGDFGGDQHADIALLTADGDVRLLTRTKQAARPRVGAGAWARGALSDERVPGATQLLTAHTSSLSQDDLLLLDAAGRRLHLLAGGAPERGGLKGRNLKASFDSEGAPVAALPMRLDVDALDDLVVLSAGAPVPSTMLTAQPVSPASVTAPQFITFTNPTSISVSSSLGNQPDAAVPYPSSITVSGQAGLVDKVRVRLHNVSGSSVEGLEILLVGPAGQKVMLMSDASSCCVISNADVTLDDQALISLSGVRITTGTYKPTDINSGADAFPAPAPAGPYAATLSAFNGTDPNGTWKLYVINDSFFSGFNGNIAGGWTLFFGPDAPQTFVVTTTNDSGAGSLRQAILDANAHLGADNISFSIGSGAQTITPASPLPTITEPITIDATTQPGFAGVPIIELDMSASSSNLTGLYIEAGQTTVRGLVVNGFQEAGIRLSVRGSNIIEGNYIGTDLSGTVDKVSSGDGVEINTAGNTVGGTTAAARNVLSGCNDGIQFRSSAANNLIQGNYLGTNAAGTAPLKNTFSGVSTLSAPGSPNNIIGGTTAGARNVISGNGFNGVELHYDGSHGTLIQGNYMGTNAAGTAVFLVSGFFLSGDGVTMGGGAHDNTIGGTTPAARNLISGNSRGVAIGQSGVSGITVNNLVEGNYIGTDPAGTAALRNNTGVVAPANVDGNQVMFNRIAFNNNDGVALTDTGGGDTPGVSIAIVENDIFANGDLGIDLGPSGITPNDTNDPDAGPNFLQNFPTLTSVSFPAGPAAPGALTPSATVTVNGTLNSTPNTIFIIHWYFSADTQCVRNQLQSQILASDKLVGVATDANGNAPFSFPFTFPAGTSNGIITCTATDPNGNTSELSSCLVVTDAPCTYSVAPAARTFTSASATSSVAVSAGGGCSWTAVSSASWLTITSGASGTGPGTVNYSLATNTSTSPRSATITVQGQTHTVTQDGVGGSLCSFALSPNSQGFNSAGGAGSFGVTTNCNWTAVSDATWLTTTSSGAGNGTVNFSVGANSTGAARTATINVQGQFFVVMQSAGGQITAYANPALLTINDASKATPYPATINVAGFDGVVGTLTVSLIKFSHSFSNDVDVLLVGPAGQSIVLMSDVGSSASNVTLTLSDAAAGSLPSSGSLTPGTYKPTNIGSGDGFPAPAPAGPPTGTTLAAFGGTNPNGAWSLYVVDDSGLGSGSFAAGWSLAIAPAGALQFSNATYSVNEDGGNASVSVTRTGGSAGAVSVSYATSNGTATAGSDYTAASGTLNWLDGDATTKSFTVPIVNDALVEGNETVNLTLSNPTGGAPLGSQASAVLTITDDEQPPALRIDAVLPPAGRTAGGQQVRLTGSFAGLSTVLMGGGSASWSYTNGTSEITVTTPAHAAGAVQIDLTPTTGNTYTKPNAFAYLPSVFTDDLLIIGVTPARAQHVTELRQAVDTMRAVAGLGPVQWTDPILMPFGTAIRWMHIQELRTYLDDATGRLGYPAGPAYSDPTLSAGSVIKRIHIEELRQRIRAIAG